MTRLLLLGLATAALAACGNTASDGPVDPAKAVYACPADQVLEVTDYTDVGPDASLDAAAYLAENKARKGVTTTDSGLQYVVAQKGLKNGASPVGGQVVTVHYHGYFPDGSVFDSSYERGETIDFPANRVIPGWIESLQGMKVCEARTLYIPGDLAYGPRGTRGIPPNATLLFNVQLIGVAE
ncbi:FKBP-type peptidyl-prolyl cis-trans isomerase [Litorimonas sp. RW-G-Af-16]|uniref:FKBP-type peptidyl-prolyl cis-trans isomerase n=1 Tax=Litorimonas sp. RW-G-Af-16 TaxID=3241168 RepID=UPI00390CD1E0